MARSVREKPVFGARSELAEQFLDAVRSEAARRAGLTGGADDARLEQAERALREAAGQPAPPWLREASPAVAAAAAWLPAEVASAGPPQREDPVSHPQDWAAADIEPTVVAAVPTAFGWRRRHPVLVAAAAITLLAGGAAFAAGGGLDALHTDGAKAPSETTVVAPEATATATATPTVDVAAEADRRRAAKRAAALRARRRRETVARKRRLLASERREHARRRASTQPPAPPSAPAAPLPRRSAVRRAKPVPAATPRPSSTVAPIRTPGPLRAPQGDPAGRRPPEQ